MKALISAASIAAVVTLLPAAAQAQTAHSGFYGALGYANASFEHLNFGAVQGRLGYRFLPWLGLEGELMAGVKQDSANFGGVPVDFKLKHAEMIYAVGFLPVGDNTDILARVGYGHAKIVASALGVTQSEGGDTTGFGLGFQHRFDAANGVRVDYTRQGDADVWAIAYSRRF